MNTTTIFRRLLLFHLVMTGFALYASKIPALELSLDTTDKSGSYVVTHTNNQGYKVLYWNFKLDPSFTGTGSANTVTSILFQLWVNPPQGLNIMPLNLAIYNGYFNSTNYQSTTPSSVLGQPNGTSPTTPKSSSTTPQVGIQTQVTPTATQLALLSWTPPANFSFQNYVINWTNPSPFNGTSPNANGQYSLVIWTESILNYQIKNNGQLMVGGLPGTTLSSTSPGIIDGTSGTSITTTSAGVLAVAPVPEPSSYFMATIAVVALILMAQRRRKVRPFAC